MNRRTRRALLLLATHEIHPHHRDHKLKNTTPGVHMARKNLQITVPLAPDKCFDLMFNIGSKIYDWKVKGLDKDKLIITFQQGDILSLKSVSPVQTVVSMTPLADGQTQISFAAEHYGLVDPFGFLDGAIKKLMDPFQIQAAALAAAPTGLRCPQCGRQVEAGARFCRYDGTPMPLQCPACQLLNPAGAKFCSRCGKAL
jgi:hypothetical protein